jgi:hypothetical protein
MPKYVVPRPRDLLPPHGLSGVAVTVGTERQLRQEGHKGIWGGRSRRDRERRPCGGVLSHAPWPLPHPPAATGPTRRRCACVVARSAMAERADGHARAGRESMSLAWERPPCACPRPITRAGMSQAGRYCGVGILHSLSARSRQHVVALACRSRPSIGPAARCSAGWPARHATAPRVSSEKFPQTPLTSTCGQRTRRGPPHCG